MKLKKGKVTQLPQTIKSLEIELNLKPTEKLQVDKIDRLYVRFSLWDTVTFIPDVDDDWDYFVYFFTRKPRTKLKRVMSSRNVYAAGDDFEERCLEQCEAIVKAYRAVQRSARNYTFLTS